MRRVSLAARRARMFLRRPPPPPWFRPALYASVAVLAASGGTVLGVWSIQSGWWQRSAELAVARTLELSAEAGLRLSEVYVEGRKRTGRDAVRAELGIDRGRPIFALDTAGAKQRLEQLPWIEQASIARLLPNTIRVRLIERRPLALWQRDGRFSLIDQRGRVIEGALDGIDPGRDYGQLRVLVGDDAPDRASQLFALLSTEPALSEQVVAATLVRGRRWNLHLRNGVAVQLPEENPVAAWRLLAAEERDHALLSRAVSVVDLRFVPGRIRLQLDARALGDSDA
jgi:cell division protein FtsQ